MEKPPNVTNPHWSRPLSSIQFRPDTGSRIFGIFFCSWWYSQFRTSFAVFTCRRCVQTWLVCQPGSIAASHVWCLCHIMTSWLPTTRLRHLPGRWDKFDVCCICWRLLLRCGSCFTLWSSPKYGSPHDAQRNDLICNLVSHESFLSQIKTLTLQWLTR